MVRTTFSIGKTNSFSFFTFFSGACAITDSSLHFGIIFDAFWHTFSIFFWLNFGMPFWMPLFRFLFQNGSQNGPTKKHCGSFWEPLGGKDDPKASPKRTGPRELFWIECPMVAWMLPGPSRCRFLHRFWFIRGQFWHQIWHHCRTFWHHLAMFFGIFFWSRHLGGAFQGR